MTDLPRSVASDAHEVSPPRPWFSRVMAKHRLARSPISFHIPRLPVSTVLAKAPIRHERECSRAIWKSPHLPGRPTSYLERVAKTRKLGELASANASKTQERNSNVTLGIWNALSSPRFCLYEDHAISVMFHFATLFFQQA